MIEHPAVRPLLVAIGLAVTVAAMYVAVRGVEFDDAADALRASDLRWLAPTLPVFALAIWLRAVRWWALYADDTRPPLRAVTYALMVGYLFNNILPARAGEAARVIALHRRAATPRVETLGTVVVERIFDVLALLVVLFACYPWLPEISWLRTAAIAGAVLLAGLLVAVAVLARYEERAVRWLLSPLRRVRRAGIAERAEYAVVNAMRGLVALREPRIALYGMVLTIVSWLVVGVSFWILMAAFDLDVPLAAALLVTVAINFSLVLPSGPAALGVFEAATVIALAAYDVPQADALSYALVLHLLNLVPFVLIGAILMRPRALRRGA